jgi:hypothetical protein
MAIITWQWLGRKESQFFEIGIYKTFFVETPNGRKMAKRIFYSDAR